MAAGLIVDVVTMSDAALANQVLSSIEGLDTCVIKLYPMSNALAGLADQVRAVANGSASKISVLRIWGHGWLDLGGAQCLADHCYKAEDHGVVLDVTTVNRIPADLASCFAPGARVELRACKVAANSGKQMMLALARKWNVRVHGSEATESTTTWLSIISEATPGGEWRRTTGIQIAERR
jgi:hypothetical protein